MFKPGRSRPGGEFELVEVRHQGECVAYCSQKNGISETPPGSSEEIPQFLKNSWNSGKKLLKFRENVWVAEKSFEFRKNSQNSGKSSLNSGKTQGFQENAWNSRKIPRIPERLLGFSIRKSRKLKVKKNVQGLGKFADNSFFSLYYWKCNM